MSDEEYYNFSDSSLELHYTFEPRQKSKQKSPNFVSDTIDLTNELQDNKIKELKSKQNKIINDSNDSSFIYINSSSDESFKSTNSVLSQSGYVNNSNRGLSNLSNSIKSISKLEDNDLNSASIRENKPLVFHNNYTTPKQHVQINDLSESAKLLDRIYGKEWRHINNVIKGTKKNLNDELFKNYE